MPVLSEMVHPRGLDFNSQRKVVMLRDQQGLSFPEIRKKVVNLQGQHPCEDVVRRVYYRFSDHQGHAPYQYGKCGRKAWKAPPHIRDFLVRKLLKLRKKTVCTSTVLQSILAQEKQVELSARYIRKVLQAAGFHWLPRAQKRKYSRADMNARLAFAKRALRMTIAQLKDHMALSIDGT
eukprot:4792445-Karenia_brevis.AAC.1